MQLPSTTTHPIRGVAPTVDTRPLTPVVGGRLALDAPDATGRMHVSAASGLAAAGGSAWVVSDEYGDLGWFEQLLRPGLLLPGLDRGAERPDLESLVKVPGADGASTLVAFASGSKPDRSRVLVQDLDADGTVRGPAVEGSVAPLYREFDRLLPKQPNIEGLALRQGAAGAELLAFHRGKAKGDVNTIFRLDADRVMAALRAGKPVGADVLLGHAALELGTLGGERLGFADARTLPDGRIAFVASAEGGGDIGDGTIKGSVLGILGPDLAMQALRPMTGTARKVEGLELTRELDPNASATSFTLVTDPDDPSTAAEVLTVDVG